MNKVKTEPNDPYKLDTIGEIVALTKKNSRFIEAVLNIDSNYKRENNINFGPKGKYSGSTSYWFNKMILDSGNYSEYLKEVVAAIDRSNSTHLEASLDGRKEVTKRILEKFDTLDALKEGLKKEFVPSDKEHLISIISLPIESKKKNTKKRINLSYASKFCSYASQQLLGEDLYPRYDNVVANNLYKYVNTYLLNKKVKKGQYKYKGNGHVEAMNIYEEYSKIIVEILNAASTKKPFLGKNEFDHIVWYCNK